MKAIILAAGRGNRLGKLTDHTPKCLLKLGHETILERQIRLLNESGIKNEEITIVAGYKADSFSNINASVIINKDYYKTDNAYSLFLGLNAVEDDVLIIDGDLVFEAVILERLINSPFSNVLLCSRSELNFGDTGVIVDQNNEILEIGKHIVNTQYLYLGLAKLSKNIIGVLRNKLIESFDTWYTVPLNAIISQITCLAEMVDEKVIGINTYFDYIEAQNYFGYEKCSILITGASGLLGKKIYHILKRQYHVIGTKHTSTYSDFYPLNLNDPNAVQAFFELNHPSIVINCAGIADPDICEANPDLAFQANVESVEILCKICKQYNSELIHISTDYVFDGDSYIEYSIGSQRSPRNYYGYTKMEAENIISKYENSLIVRIPIIYGYNDEYDKKTFPLQIIEALSQGKDVYLDGTQQRYPVLIDEVALMLSRSLGHTGIIHITSELAVTKFSWAKIIAKEYGLDETLIHENSFSHLENRPPHTKLELTDSSYRASDVVHGTQILKKQMYCTFKLIYSTHPGNYIYGKCVGEYRYNLGYQLGDSLPCDVINTIDCIVPVPTSGLYYAMGLSKRINKPYVQGLYKEDTSARSFQIADNQIREKIIRSKIMPIKPLIQGKRIILVDEAIFTGTTLKVICDICKACGAAKIYICIPTPPCYHRCMQYMRPERALITEYVQHNNLKDYFKVEGIFYQPFTTFQNSINDIPQICYECFEGIEDQEE